MFSVNTWIFQMVSLLRVCVSLLPYMFHIARSNTRRKRPITDVHLHARPKLSLYIYIYVVRYIASGGRFWNRSCRDAEAKIFPAVHDDPFPQSTHLRCLTVTSLTPCVIFSHTRHILALQAALQRMDIACCALRAGVILKILSFRLCCMDVLADWITALV